MSYELDIQTEVFHYPEFEEELSGEVTMGGSSPKPRVLTFSKQDVIDERISVPAQYSLVRLSKNPSTSIDAVGMLEAVKSGRLAGIYCVNWKRASDRAEMLGKHWWTVIPTGEDAVLMLDPGNLVSGPPLIAFRRELDPRNDKGCGRLPTDKSLTPQPARLDAAMLRAWKTYVRFRGGEITPFCTPAAIGRPYFRTTTTKNQVAAAPLTSDPVVPPCCANVPSQQPACLPRQEGCLYHVNSRKDIYPAISGFSWNEIQTSANSSVILMFCIEDGKPCKSLSSASRWYGFASGTLIHRNVILTAWHPLKDLIFAKYNIPEPNGSPSSCNIDRIAAVLSYECTEKSAGTRMCPNRPRADHCLNCRVCTPQPKCPPPGELNTLTLKCEGADFIWEINSEHTDFCTQKEELRSRALYPSRPWATVKRILERDDILDYALLLIDWVSPDWYVTNILKQPGRIAHPSRRVVRPTGYPSSKVLSISHPCGEPTQISVGTVCDVNRELDIESKVFKYPVFSLATFPACHASSGGGVFAKNPIPGASLDFVGVIIGGHSSIRRARTVNNAVCSESDRATKCCWLTGYLQMEDAIRASRRLRRYVDSDYSDPPLLNSDQSC